MQKWAGNGLSYGLVDLGRGREHPGMDGLWRGYLSGPHYGTFLCRLEAEGQQAL